MKAIKATLNAIQKEILLSIYDNGYTPNTDKKAHNRNVKTLRDNGYLNKNNEISKKGIDYVKKHVLGEKTTVGKHEKTTVDYSKVDYSKLTKNQLIALLQNPCFEMIANHGKSINSIKANSTIELIDRKKRSIRVDKKIFDEYLKAIKGKVFSSYDNVNTFNIDFAKEAKLIKIAKKDNKVKISNNFKTDCKLHLVHFLNSYCYKNNYMK